MKIIHLRASNFYGGPERQLHFHAKKALHSDYEIIISSFLENSQTPDFIKVIADDSLQTTVFNVKGSYDTNASKIVKQYLMDNDISILCTHDYRTHFIGMIAAKKANAKWLAFSRGWTTENLKIKLFHALDKLIIRFADHIVAVSEAQKKKLEKLFIRDDKISVVHNSIEPDAFNHIDPVDLRKKFNLPYDSTIGITGGRFSPEKGQIYLVDAANKVIARNDKLRFILFGEGPDYQRIITHIKKMNIEDKVICPGFEKNLIGCLKGADFLVNPSLSEGLPNIVLEAMAMKIPCVATSVGGVPELIQNNENGILCNAGDVLDLADKIEQLATNKDLAQKIIANGYDTIIKHYSFDSQFKKLSSIYRDLLS